MTLATISLILPNFTLSMEDGSLSALQAILFSVITVLLYATFLAIQTTRHRGFFLQPELGATAGATMGMAGRAAAAGTRSITTSSSDRSRITP